MQSLPFLLVILSSIAHGYWNYLFKQAHDKDAFLGLSKGLEPVIYAVPFVFAVIRWGWGESTPYYVAGGTVLAIANYVCLAASYKRLDLSIAYPVSRSSTLFLPFLAFLFFNERIDAVGWASVLAVSVGVIVAQLGGNNRSGKASSGTRKPGSGWGLVFALVAALTVALYTLWGKAAVRHIHPFVYMYCYTLASNAYFFPSLRRLDPEVVRREWRCNKWRILAVSVLNTLSFVLMLLALNLGKVTYVGALRQLSLVVGVGLGVFFLRERMSWPRVAGVLLIIAGACLVYVAE